MSADAERIQGTAGRKLIGVGRVASVEFTGAIHIGTEVADALAEPLGIVPFPALAAGERTHETVAMIVPESTEPGMYRVLLTLDADNELPETFEDNNVLRRLSGSWLLEVLP